MKLEISGQFFFEKYWTTEFNENSSSGRRVVPCGRIDGWTDGQADMGKLIVAFRNLANSPKSSYYFPTQGQMIGSYKRDGECFTARYGLGL